MSHADSFLELACRAIAETSRSGVEAMAEGLAAARAGAGRVFVVGVGGSAANASHAVNDFRKLCDIEAYAPTDNVAELTARTNDEGWESTIAAWLETSRIGPGDALLVLSVGGGSIEHGVSLNLVKALDLARERGAATFAIVGRDDGHAARVSDIAVVVPTVDESLLTPLAEALQSVVLHCLVTHPSLRRRAAKWEGLADGVGGRP